MSSAHPLSGLVVVEIGHDRRALCWDDPWRARRRGHQGREPERRRRRRGWGPPFAEGAATCFHAVNRGKQGITCDLADPEDAARLKRLILERADVVIHNLKFGALDKYGLAPAALVAEKPGLVCCNLNAFGAVGPLRERPGYDPMMQAYSGLMSLLGEDGRPPVRVSASIIDMGTANWAVVGILAALRERDRTGKGGIVDTSLYETSLALMSILLADHLTTGEVPARHGSGVPMIVPYQAFEAADGYMMVAAGNDNLFRRLAAALGRPSLAEDPRFATNGNRVVHRKALVAILADIFKTETRGHWAALFEARAFPAARSMRWIRSSLTRRPRRSAQIQQNGALSLVGLPLSFDGARPEFTKRAPALGEDNAAILG